jgi:hypothetical protein
VPALLSPQLQLTSGDACRSRHARQFKIVRRLDPEQDINELPPKPKGTGGPTRASLSATRRMTTGGRSRLCGGLGCGCETSVTSSRSRGAPGERARAGFSPLQPHLNPKPDQRRAAPGER